MNHWKLLLISPLFLLNTIVAAQNPTKIVILKPYPQEDTLRPGLIVAQRYQGSCVTHSVASPGRQDAWHCSASNVTLDPCFQDHDSLACLDTPWSHKVVILELKSPLQKRTQVSKKITTFHPWGVELANGQYCTYLTGASFVIKKIRINYTCGSYKYNIIGEINRSTPVWTVLLYDYDNKSLRLLNVTTAYY